MTQYNDLSRRTKTICGESSRGVSEAEASSRAHAHRGDHKCRCACAALDAPYAHLNFVSSIGPPPARVINSN